MPVVGSSAYKHGRARLVLARAFVAERRARESVYGAVLLPYVNSAYRQSAARDGQLWSGGFLSDERVLVVTAVTATTRRSKCHHRRNCAAQSTTTDLALPLKCGARGTDRATNFAEMGGPNSPWRMPGRARKT